MWIDAHAHLYDLSDNELAASLDTAEKGGVCRIINTATSIATSRQVIRQTSIDKRLLAAAGISPFDVEGLDSDWTQILDSLLAAPEVVGVGEIGIDGSNTRYPPLQHQIPVFGQQLAMASSRGLTAIVHSRGAERQAIDICKSAGAAKVIFHCYTGSQDDLRLLLDCGYYVSFSGILTFKNNPLTGLAAYAPLDRILIETDTPYLAPVPHRGKRNCPAWVALTGLALAEIKGISGEETAAHIARNAGELFGL
jgi:TatD DNase family protein